MLFGLLWLFFFWWVFEVWLSVFRVGVNCCFEFLFCNFGGCVLFRFLGGCLLVFLGWFVWLFW